MEQSIKAHIQIKFPPDRPLRPGKSRDNLFELMYFWTSLSPDQQHEIMQKLRDFVASNARKAPADDPPAMKN